MQLENEKGTWLPELGLNKSDKPILLSCSECLTDKLVNGAQTFFERVQSYMQCQDYRKFFLVIPTSLKHNIGNSCKFCIAMCIGLLFTQKA